MRRGFAARKKRAAIALSLVFLCLFSACAVHGRNASKATWLTVGTADAGGSMYANGSELAAAITARDEGLRFNLKASTGSPGNLRALLSGEVDLALITADIAAKAKEESGGEELRVIAAIYPSVSHWMALRESGITTVSELKGSALAIGPENSATEHASERVFEKLRFPETGNYYYAGMRSRVFRRRDSKNWPRQRTAFCFAMKARNSIKFSPERRNIFRPSSRRAAIPDRRRISRVSG